MKRWTTEEVRAQIHGELDRWHGEEYETLKGLLDDLIKAHARELAEAIREETRRLKAAEVLEPDKYRPCRDAADQIDPEAASADG